MEKMDREFKETLQQKVDEGVRVALLELEKDEEKEKKMEEKKAGAKTATTDNAAAATDFPEMKKTKGSDTTATGKKEVEGLSEAIIAKEAAVK